MRKLKSFYLQIEKVKSAPLEYANYLIDKRRHKGQEILPLCDVLNSAQSLEDDKTWFHSKMKRGGHIPSPAYSLVVSFPFSLTKEKWEKMNEEMLDYFFKMVLTDILPNENIDLLKHQLKRKTLAVVHRGNHCHFMIPKILKEPKTVLDFSKKKYMYALKDWVNNYEENRKIFDNYRVDETTEKLNRSSAKLEAHKKHKETEITAIKEETRAIIEQEHLSPLIVEIDTIIKGLKSLKIDGDIIRGLEKRRSTIEKQLENGNTIRAEAQLKQARKTATEAIPTKSI